MVFSSHIFIFYFLPASLLLYYLMPGRALKHLSLTLVSYVFYGWANPKFVLVMVATTTIDYLGALVQAHNGFGGWRIASWRQPAPLLEKNAPRSRTQKGALLFSLCVNLGLLGFFKYFNFAVDNTRALAETLGVSAAGLDSVLRVALPLGISFYTFQSMSYAIDVYRGDTRAMKNFNDYTCFVAQYQQMVAGPIVRYSELADQLEARRHTIDKFARGVALFSLGLAMKVLLANPCGKIADTVFNAAGVSTLNAWYGATAYAFQIYFDFAGYSEMAVGLGLMMGFVFAKNFETPYQSGSVTEFWRRWHISLSSWLRDYLYIPLGGSRRGEARTYINLALTMLLGGLWHGASWNFVIWGALHGGALALERRFGERLYGRLPLWMRRGIVFGFVLVAWVFFRTSDLPAALAHLGSMSGLRQPPAAAALLDGIIFQPYYLMSFGLAAVAAFCSPSAWAWTQHLTAPKAAACIGLLWLALVMLATQAYNPFIYFIF